MIGIVRNSIWQTTNGNTRARGPTTRIGCHLAHQFTRCPLFPLTTSLSQLASSSSPELCTYISRKRSEPPRDLLLSFHPVMSVHCSPPPLTPLFPSFSKPGRHLATLVDDLHLGLPFSKPDRRPSQGNRPSATFGESNRHPSVPSIRYPSGPPLSRPINEIPAARVSKPAHLVPVSLEAPAPSSSSEPHGRPPISPLTYLPQSNSQPSAPRSVTSSSLRVPSVSKPGSKASAPIPSSPSIFNVRPHPLCMARHVMGIRNDMPAVCCPALIGLVGY